MQKKSIQQLSSDAMRSSSERRVEEERDGEGEVDKAEGA